MSVRHRIAVACVVVACLATSSVRGALIVQGYDTNLHDRFSNSSSFIGNPHDWSGVGRGSHWATMISDSFFLSARHYRPADGTNVTFYHSNDPAGSSEVHTVAEGWVMSDSDLWLGRLDTAVSASVAKYSVLDVSPAAVASLEVSTFGRATGFASAANQRMGRNEVDTFLPAVSGTGLVGTGDVFTYDYDATGGVGADEAMVTTGDSGAPTFVLTDDGPAILGVHWYEYDDIDGMGSGDTFVTSYLSEMNTQMAAFNQSVTVVAIPEPSHLVLLCCLVTGCVFQRRRVRGRCVTCAGNDL